MKDSYPFLREGEKRLLAREEKKLGHCLTEMAPPGYSMCFACGRDNPAGLHLHFFDSGSGCISFFTPGKEHQSYNDRMHGGLILTLMDEVMGNAIFLREGIPAYTGRMESRFRAPVQIGESVMITAAEIKRKGSLSVMEARIIKEDGTVCAEAVSYMMLERKRSNKMTKEELKGKIESLIAAESCCGELKEAGKAFLEAMGTEKEKDAAEAFRKELAADVNTLEQVIPFFESEAAAGYFGKEKAAELAAAAREAEKKGVKYCICPACTVGGWLLDHQDEF